MKQLELANNYRRTDLSADSYYHEVTNNGSINQIQAQLRDALLAHSNDKPTQWITCILPAKTQGRLLQQKIPEIGVLQILWQEPAEAADLIRQTIKARRSHAVIGIVSRLDAVQRETIEALCTQNQVYCTVVNSF